MLQLFYIRTDASRQIGRVLVLDEGNKIGGWGAEVASIVHENAFSSLHAPAERVGAADYPIPSAMPMECQVISSLEVLKKSINQLFRET
jgi:pyruvate/2-oxoglutarate/acetoin dehydrogenase E1 component